MERFDENQFWLKHIARKEESNQARISHKLYYIEPEDGPVFPRGMAGIPHVIEFMDGRLVRTTNLWTCGSIPEAYQKDLADNAVFRETDKEAEELWRAYKKRPWYKPSRRWR
jgi:hypothetical protein